MTNSVTLIKIEDMMLDLCSGKYHWQDAESVLDHYVDHALKVYNPHITYSPMIKAYFDKMYIIELALLSRRKLVKVPRPLFESSDEFAEFCDDLMDKQDEYLSRCRRQRSRNRIKMQQDFKELLDNHCKLLLVRIDISYLSDPTIDQFAADLKVLRARMHNRDGCFKGVLRYSWAIEQGRDTGYHCHLLFIYNGSKHMKDEYYGRRIGEVWKEITNKDGIYFNCNSKKYKDNYRQHDTLGIGMIDRRKPREVENALTAVSYLAKAEKVNQYMRAMQYGMRCFG